MARRMRLNLLDRDSSWKVSVPSSLAQFLRALCALMPDGSVFYVECGGFPRADKDFFRERGLPEKMCVPGGTLFLGPDEFFHLSLTVENMEDLAALWRNEPGLPTHIHVYRGGEMLLQWFDASAGDPMFLSKSIPADRVRDFCADIGSGHAP